MTVERFDQLASAARRSGRHRAVETACHRCVAAAPDPARPATPEPHGLGRVVSLAAYAAARPTGPCPTCPQGPAAA